MVVVFMGDQDGIKLGGRELERLQTLLHCLGGVAAVHEQAGVPRGDEQSIACTAAAGQRATHAGLLLAAFQVLGHGTQQLARDLALLPATFLVQ